MRIENGVYVYKASGVEIRIGCRLSLEERKKLIKSVRELKKIGLVYVILKMNDHGRITIDVVNKVVTMEYGSFELSGTSALPESEASRTIPQTSCVFCGMIIIELPFFVSCLLAAGILLPLHLSVYRRIPSSWRWRSAGSGAPD